MAVHYKLCAAIVSYLAEFLCILDDPVEVRILHKEASRLIVISESLGKSVLVSDAVLGRDDYDFAASSE